MSCLILGDVPEACPLGLAPSSSTAAMLAMGDALALTVMELKGVKPDQYATFHPGGALGRSLMKVHEIMRVDTDCPTIPIEGSLQDYYTAIEQAPRRAGAAMIIDADRALRGIFTHGDLFRLRLASSDPAQVAHCRDHDLAVQVGPGSTPVWLPPLALMRKTPYRRTAGRR